MGDDGGIGDSTLPYKPSLAWKLLEKAFSPSKHRQSYRSFYYSSSVREEFFAKDPVHGPVLKNVDEAWDEARVRALMAAYVGYGYAVLAFKMTPGNQRQRFEASACCMLATIPAYMFVSYVGEKFTQNKYPVDRLDAETAEAKFREWFEEEWVVKKRVADEEKAQKRMAMFREWFYKKAGGN